MQRDNIAIASLEIRTADLLAAKAELERQQEEEKVKISDLEEIRFAGRLSEKIVDAEIEKDEAVRELGQLIQVSI